MFLHQNYPCDPYIDNKLQYCREHTDIDEALSYYISTSTSKHSQSKSTENARNDPGSESENSSNDPGSESENSSNDSGSETENSSNDSGSETEDSSNDPGSETEDSSNDPGSETEDSSNDSDSETLVEDPELYKVEQIAKHIGRCIIIYPEGNNALRTSEDEESEAIIFIQKKSKLIEVYESADW